ncbi:ABC transporter substrate-binding protein [candidate division KSB1 bacterium]|nr:ABC transporter substrate-binding protein [candidate division KSB1 bacterium]
MNIKNKLYMNARLSIILVVIGISVGGCQEQPVKPEEIEKVTLGVETSLLTAPVWVAENKGYFEREGLDLTIKEFDSGRTALATMLNEGNLDMVTVAQTPVMFNSFDRDDYVIIATMVYSNNDVKILTRQDRGIKNPSDLKGKTVGITKGSTGHFFLGLFLIHSGLQLSEVETIDIEASELPQALVDGRVDAISTWEPHIWNAKKLLDENAVRLQPRGGAKIFREDFYFVPNRNFMDNNPETLKRFLKAIEKGEEFIQKNKEEAINIVSQRLKLDKELVVSIWNDFEFQLILDQAIIITLEDEARWAIDNNLTDATEVPNYLDYIYSDILEEIKPKAVTIIR